MFSLGEHRVFMDRVEIRGGDDWRTKINTALSDATVVLSIIGQRWLTLTDEWRRLRIDRDDDWVRQEIRAALNHRKGLIPIYVDEAPLITQPEAVPVDIRGLLDAQAIMLTPNYWDQGLIDLIRRLERYGFELHNSAIPMPERRKKVLPLAKGELDHLRQTHLEWSVVTSYFSLGYRDAPIPRTELHKEYRFRSFPDATRFMASISNRIEEGQHHPRWENIWTTVRVWLSTWDIEFQPSSFDLNLAKLIDEEYNKFDGRPLS
jgi:pterin-4a-carbinolamine dehydratase